MKKIYLTLVLVLASMMVVAGPDYKFMGGHTIEGGQSIKGGHTIQGGQSIENGFQVVGAMGSSYDSNHSGINGSSYDASIYGGAGRTEGHGYGVRRDDKALTGAGGQSLGTMGSMSSRGNGGYSGGGASGAAGGSGFNNPFTTSDGITLGLNGKKANIGDDLSPWTNPVGTYQPPKENPLGDAIAPLMLLVLAFVAFKFWKR